MTEQGYVKHILNEISTREEKASEKKEAPKKNISAGIT